MGKKGTFKRFINLIFNCNMKNCAVKYIFIDSGSFASKLMFKDLKGYKDVVETSDVYLIKNKLLWILNKVHIRMKTNKLKRIWNRYCILEGYKRIHATKVVVFTNVSIRKICLSYLWELKERNDYKFILVSVDSSVVKGLSPIPYIKKFPFDLVYSFDKKDCDAYGMRYTTFLYSKVDDITPSSNKSDLFFIGRSNDRDKMVCEIAKKAENNDLECNFNILNKSRKQQIKTKGIKYISKLIPYKDVLPQILSSKCLLDLVRKGQEGMTMRVFEAIFYNKPLITNNENVKSLRYYDPQYMQVISCVDDIDFDLIKNSGTIDYGYSGEYSPRNFIAQIENDLKELK